MIDDACLLKEREIDTALATHTYTSIDDDDDEEEETMMILFVLFPSQRIGNTLSRVATVWSASRFVASNGYCMVPRIVPPSSFLIAIVVCMLLLLELVQSPQELLLDPWLAEGTHPALVLEGEIFDATKATLFLRGMTF